MNKSTSNSYPAHIPPHKRVVSIPPEHVRACSPPAGSAEAPSGGGGGGDGGGSGVSVAMNSHTAFPALRKPRTLEERPRRSAIPLAYTQSDLVCDAWALPAGLDASFCAAGVLPWRRRAGGELELLLGVEPDKAPPYAASLSLLFGKVKTDETAAATAVREFDEEAAGVLGLAWRAAAAAALRLPLSAPPNVPPPAAGEADALPPELPAAAAAAAAADGAVDELGWRLQALAVADGYASPRAVWNYSSKSVTFVAAAADILGLDGAPSAEELCGRHAERVAGLSDEQRRKLEYPALALHWVQLAAICEHRSWSDGTNAAAVAAGVPAPLRSFIRSMFAPRSKLRLLLQELELAPEARARSKGGRPSGRPSFRTRI